MKLTTVGLSMLLSVSPLVAADRMVVSIDEPLEFETKTIDYFGETSDPVAQLRRRIEQGNIKFTGRGRSGYLTDLLKALEIPVASQSLVFSRTSLQGEHVHPSKPRALYFNDHVTVGWVPDTPVLEIAAHDPVKGAIFYTLNQPVDGQTAQPLVWHRDTRCTDCHRNPTSFNVPGYLLRSFLVDQDGERDSNFPGVEVNHTVPFHLRWGGWYVSGQAAGLSHRGNLIGEEENLKHEDDPQFRGTQADLKSLVDLSSYPNTKSDIVALLIMEHQSHFYNLVTRLQYEHRHHVKSDAEELLARYALMEEEAKFPVAISGDSDYSSWYQKQGNRNSKGLNLRKLNLRTRLFEHRLSPLIYSTPFLSLPDDVKARLWARFRNERGEIIDANPPKLSSPVQKIAREEISTPGSVSGRASDAR